MKSSQLSMKTGLMSTDNDIAPQDDVFSNHSGMNFWTNFLITFLASSALFAQASCEKLMALKIPHTEMTAATSLPAGTLPRGGNAVPLAVPARCVVKARSRPTKDSEIRIEVWLPASGWNGKYQQVGNGGWAGSIPTHSLALALQRGYAVAATNTGHDEGHPDGPAAWAIGHPEKMIDFGHRSLRETTVVAKAMIAALYGKDPAYSYFVGCSNGGRQVLMEAQRYPEDFDGIIAGAPANDFTNLLTGFVWNEQALSEDTKSKIPPAKLSAIQKAALAACDSLDGVKDGLVEDPRKCSFNPEVLLCQGAENNECLNPSQIKALKKIYSGPVNSRTGKQIYPGFPAGTEAVAGTWLPWVVAEDPAKTLHAGFGNSLYSQAVFENLRWNYRELNFDHDVEWGNQKVGAVVNSTNPDLRSFRARGGKLIQYHGWADAAIPGYGSIEYYEKAKVFLEKYPDGRSDISKPVTDFYRLFMVPGMGHCAGGIGANQFGTAGGSASPDPERDFLTALEQWVEKGIAPEKFIGTGKATDDPSKTLTRPICSFPQVARYKGTGDPNQASSFTCSLPAK